MILMSEAQWLDLLRTSSTVAVVGASNKPDRPSYDVFTYVLADGRLHPTPINPTIEAIDGVAALPSLTAFAQAHGAPDIVDVFRKPADCVEVAREAVAVGAKAIWFQLGVINPEAVRIADEAGLAVVVDRCLKIELWKLPSSSLGHRSTGSG